MKKRRFLLSRKILMWGCLSCLLLTLNISQANAAPLSVHYFSIAPSSSQAVSPRSDVLVYKYHRTNGQRV